MAAAEASRRRRPGRGAGIQPPAVAGDGAEGAARRGARWRARPTCSESRLGQRARLRHQLTRPQRRGMLEADAHLHRDEAARRRDGRSGGGGGGGGGGARGRRAGREGGEATADVGWPVEQLRRRWSGRGGGAPATTRDGSPAIDAVAEPPPPTRPPRPRRMTHGGGGSPARRHGRRGRAATAHRGRITPAAMMTTTMEAWRRGGGRRWRLR